MFIPQVKVTVAASVISYLTSTVQAMKISNADALHLQVQPQRRSEVSSCASSPAFITLAPSQIINSKHVQKMRRRRESQCSYSTPISRLNLVPSQIIHGTDGGSFNKMRNASSTRTDTLQRSRQDQMMRTSTSTSSLCTLLESESSQPESMTGAAAIDNQRVNTNTGKPKSNGKQNDMASSENETRTMKIKEKGDTKGKGKSEKKKQLYKYHGNLPDIDWRAIPMEHLRSHPYFTPLPHPDTIKHLSKAEDARYFRQDSWQWDELHRGRCTTSQAAPALGFLEPSASSDLGIPRSLQKGCTGAFQRLSQPSIRSLDEMNRILCTAGNGGEHRNHRVWTLMMKDYEGGKHKNKYSNQSRTSPSSGSRKRHYPFVARYLPVCTQKQRDERRREAKEYMRSIASPMVVRMQWGNSQEATAILTALNCFSKTDPGMRMREVGMCGAGLDMNFTTSSSDVDIPQDVNIFGGGNSTHTRHKGDMGGLLLGASPDAVVEYSNGTLEVLEVKNHCPFVPAEWMSGKKSKKRFGDYRIRELPMQESVPPVYIPQLMMEMLCVGKNCRSAVMVRQTATCGAVLLRLHRDDEWIEEMLYWLQRFVTEFVNENKPPPRNFFYDCQRYKEFVRWTKDLSEQVDLVEHVPHSSIQRVLSDRGVGISLFLD